MNQQHMPPGTRAAILRAVIAERYPKQALGAISARYGVTDQEVRFVIDAAGYPDNAKMRQAASDYELQEPAHQAAQVAEQQRETQAADVAKAALDAVAPLDRTDELQLTTVRLTDLHMDPDNVRDTISPDDPEIIDLADSIASAGLLEPIVARREIDGSFTRLVIVMGHRRYVAMRYRLKWTSTKVLVRGAMLPGEVIAAMLIENGQRKDLDPISEARGLKRLQVIMDCTEAELARRIGRSGVFVRSRILLLSLSAEEQDRIRRGELTIGAAGHKAALDSGRTGNKGVDRDWHLGPTHDLSEAVRARCRRLGHKVGRKVGGTGCGECWESVIRADARRDFVVVSHRTGECPVCHTPVEREPDREAATA